MMKPFLTSATFNDLPGMYGFQFLWYPGLKNFASFGTISRPSDLVGKIRTIIFEKVNKFGHVYTLGLREEDD